jgi:cytoskeletal protein CcmA (bactofilin family)
MNAKRNIADRSGFALLAVLMIVMVIAVLSLGYLSRSDVELACGRNMEMRAQMDYLAESGLEHARGLILNPQDVAWEYWTGESLQQLVADSSDYYDLAVVRDDTDPSDRCNYIIDSNSYRLEGGQKTSRSELRATLRLDPCVALWTRSDASLWSGVTIHGDVFCNGHLENEGTIDGDVFANTLSGTISGRHSTTAELALSWPRVTVADYTSNYATQSISTGVLGDQTFGPYNPPRVCYRGGNLSLVGNVQVESMLIVDGNLVVWGNGNRITAAKNLPALLVTGDLEVERSSNLEINGLAVVNGDVRINEDAANMDTKGGFFVGGKLIQTLRDETGNNTGALFNGPIWQPVSGYTGGALEFNGDDTAVEIGTNAFIPQQGTLSTWAYAAGFSGSYHHYIFGHTSTTEWTDRIQLYAQQGTSQLYLGLGDSHVRHADIQSLNTNTWYHIAVTWDGTNYIVYVDGAERATGSYTGLSTIGSIADIGNTGNPVYRIESWDGLIDDVRIYNRVLDANDVYPPTDGLSGLVGHWKLDEAGSSITVTAAPTKTAILTWSATGDVEKWGQAAGAFYRSIERK